MLVIENVFNETGNFYSHQAFEQVECALINIQIHICDFQVVGKFVINCNCVFILQFLPALSCLKTRSLAFWKTRVSM